MIIDDQLDAQARALPAYRPGGAQLERARTGLLAAAADVTPLPARVVTPRVMMIGAGVAVAAAAAMIALWLGRGTGDAFHGSRATIAAAPGATYAAASWQPDEVVRLANGELTVEVARLEQRERFRVETGDAEVEVRAARFVVAAEADVLTRVQVVSGVVEVRPAGRDAVTLQAGETWPRQKLAVSDTVPAPDPVPVPAPVAAAPAPAPAPKHSRHSTPSTNTSTSTLTRTNPTTITITDQKPVSAGEAEFRAGWDAMKRGDHAAAAASFAASRTAAGSTVVEDATFWEGVALARAGSSAAAITALKRFTAKYPTSARIGEASARLGWLLLDAGDQDGAAAMFHASENDRVASVRASARKGLTTLGR